MNQPQTGPELEAIRNAVRRDRPIGTHAWQIDIAARLGLTLRPKGRPVAAGRDTGGEAGDLFAEDPDK